MTKATALRAAAIIVLLQGLLQGWSVFSAQPAGFAETIVVTTMKGTHLSFGGAVRTYWDLYFGYGLFAAASWIFEAALLWIVAGMVRNDHRGTSSIILLALVATCAHAFACFVWFTPMSLVFDIPVALALLAALKLRPTLA